MKRIFIISLISFAACNSTVNTNNNNSNQLSTNLVNNPHTANGIDTLAANMKPVMDFKDTVHDFGAMHEGEVVQHEFAFTNTGKSPLIITSAAGSCGCTIPDYPHDPVAPGQSSLIKVSFNSSGKSEHQEKTVTIHTNTLRAIQMLYIKADVAKKK